MKSFCLSCIVTPELYETTLGLWIPMGMAGCQEIETAQGTEIKCFFNDEITRDKAKAELHKVHPQVEITPYEVPDQDWNAKWKASMEPALIAPGIWVSPNWLPPKTKPSDHWIKIEPKMAFGTGHHATTRRAGATIQKISSLLPKDFSLLDIGCGSGVLCFIAELYGAGKTLGVELDPVCAENLAENRRENPCPRSNAFAIGTINMLRIAPKFDCIVMNMISAESEPLLPDVKTLLNPTGYLIWSGLLTEEKPVILKNASQKGFALCDESFEEEWWCGVFRKSE